MLGSRFLGNDIQHGALHAHLQGAFDRLREGYRASLTRAVDHCGAMLGLSGLILALTFVLFAQVRRGFIPSEDTGQIIGTTLAPEGTTFDQLNAMRQQVAKIVAANPAIATVMSNAVMLAPSKIGLPYGVIPRLMMAWMTTEAVRAKQRDLVLGDR